MLCHQSWLTEVYLKTAMMWISKDPEVLAGVDAILKRQGMVQGSTSLVCVLDRVTWTLGWVFLATVWQANKVFCHLFAF